MKIRKKRVIIFSLLLSLPVILAGCWNNVDLTELAIVTAVGLDRTEEGDILLTLQMVKPGTIKAISQGSASEPVWVHSSTGETVFSAIRNQLTTLNRKGYFSHVQLMVIGESIAREGLRDVFDFFERDKETQRMAELIVARGITAREVLQARSELETIPALHIRSLLENSESLAKIKKTFFFDGIRRIRIRGYSLGIGVIQRKNYSERGGGEAGGKKVEDGGGDGQEKGSGGRQDKDEGQLQIKDLKVEGTAVIKGGKLVGYLDPFETRGLLFAQNEVKSGIINVDNPREVGKNVGFEIIHSSGTISSELKNDELKFLIEIESSGRLADQQGLGDLTRPDVVKEMEGMVEEVIRNNIQGAVAKARLYRSDFFGFVKLIYGDHYQYWERIKDSWDEVFSETPVEVKVEWKTTSSSLIKKSGQPYLDFGK